MMSANDLLNLMLDNSKRKEVIVGCNGKFYPLEDMVVGFAADKNNQITETSPIVLLCDDLEELHIKIDFLNN